MVSLNQKVKNFTINLQRRIGNSLYERFGDILTTEMNSKGLKELGLAGPSLYDELGTITTPKANPRELSALEEAEYTGIFPRQCDYSLKNNI